MSKRIITAAALALPLALILSACADTTDDAGSSDDSTGSNEVVRLGTVGAGDPYWAAFVEAAAEEGIDLEIVDFTEYPQPNPALAANEIDLNQFQHIIYLATYNEAAGDDLVPIGSTAIYPLGLYSTQYDSVDEIPEGATVAVPDDDSNQARGLLILQSAGLITLNDGGSVFSTLSDIDQANSKVTVTALEAAVTATSLPDVAAAIINNDFVEDAGLTPADAIAQDDPADPSALPYVNIFAARADDADNPTYLKLVEIYQNTPEILDGVLEASGGTAELVQIPAADLVAALDQVQEDIRNQ